MPSSNRQNASSSNARLAWTLGVSGTASEHRRLGGRFDGADEAFARTMDASTLHRRRTSNVKSSWHGKAFLVEALVLLAFLVMSLAVLITLFVNARLESAGGERLAQVRDMRVMGRSDVNRIDARVCIELIVGFVHALNAIALGKCPRLLDRAVGNARKRTPGERHDLRHLVCNYTAADNRPAQLGRREDILGEWLRANTRERGVGCSGGVERGGNLIGHVLLLLRGDERDDRRGRCGYREKRPHCIS